MSSQWWLFALCGIVLVLACRYLSQQDWDNADILLKGWRQHKKGGGGSQESSGEAKCRAFLEARFGQPFPKVRPDFLFNPVTKSTLELDGYCAPLKLAFEYQGRQHYDFSPHFHKTRADFYNGQYRDEMKAKLCRQHGIRLLVVPYNCGDEATYLASLLDRSR